MEINKELILSHTKEVIFVDTGAFFALKNELDESHETAVECNKKLLINRNKIKLVTTKPIFYESLNLARMKLRLSTAIELGEMLYNTKFIEIFDIDSDLEKEAWDIYQKYTDKDYSFTDCTSFVFMKKYKIKKVFAFDGHFEHFGFEMLK